MRPILCCLTIVLAVTANAESLDAFAKVYIYREGRFIGSALKPDIFADGVELVSIPDGTYYAGLFPPGEHAIELYDRKSGAKLVMEAGKSYYFRVEIVPGVWKGGARITMMQPEQGSYEVQKLREVDAADIHNKKIRQVRSEDYWKLKTMADMTAIVQRVLQRHVRRGKVPERLPAQVGVETGNPEFHDAWGSPLRYQVSEDRTSFVLVSAGSGGSFDEASWSHPDASMTDESEDCVIRGSATGAEFVRMWSQK